LRAVVSAPTLLEDGRIVTEPGFDEDSGLYLEPDGDYPALQEITPANARDVASVAAAHLLDPFSEFPFHDPENAAGASRAATLALILTPAGRHSFRGPSAVFASLSSTPGTGKTLLARAGALIATGAEPFLLPPPARDEEMGKVLTTILLEGTPFVLFDNASGSFGSKEFSAATTSEEYGGRVLGLSRSARGRFLATVAVTGNNVQFVKDTGRRVCPIRLESDLADPEHRKFRIRDLMADVRERRRELYMHALTILRAYRIAGMPKHDRIPMQSHVGWDDAIRGAVLWIGLGDPCGGRDEIKESAEPERDTLRAFLTAAYDIFGCDTFNVSGLIMKAEGSVPLKNALLDLQPREKGEDGAKRALDSKQIGYRLRSWRNRVLDLRGDDGERIGDYRLVRAGANRYGALYRIDEVRHA
jgi:hypothetical protein